MVVYKMSDTVRKRKGMKKRRNLLPSVVVLRVVVAHCGCAAYSIDSKATNY